MPRLEEEHKVKAGSELALPCVQGGEWARAGQTVRGGGDIILDRETGSLVILSKLVIRCARSRQNLLFSFIRQCIINLLGFCHYSDRAEEARAVSKGGAYDLIW